MVCVRRLTSWLPFGWRSGLGTAMGQLACCPECQQVQPFLLGLGGLVPSEPLIWDCQLWAVIPGPR